MVTPSTSASTKPSPTDIKCPFCQRSEYMKSDVIHMESVRAVFECAACCMFRLARPSEMEVWAKMKGRLPLPPPVSDALTLDPEVVARSTNIVTG